MATKSLSTILGGVTRFGRLEVLGDAPPKIAESGFSARCAYVRCECGVEKVVRAGDLKNGCATSCGCYQKQCAALAGKNNTTHGQSKKKTRISEYAIWTTMIQRCHNSRCKGYLEYGARGIAVCERWRSSFINFFADMGVRPSKAHSIDRIDNDGGYTPENCRWATEDVQKNNRRSSVIIEFGGKTQTASQWANELGIEKQALYARLKRGWQGDAAILRPKRKMKPRLD